MFHVPEPAARAWQRTEQFLQRHLPARPKTAPVSADARASAEPGACYASTGVSTNTGIVRVVLFWYPA